MGEKRAEEFNAMPFWHALSRPKGAKARNLWPHLEGGGGGATN